MKNPLTLLVVHELENSKAFYIQMLGAKLVEDNHDCIKLKVGNHDILMFQGTSKSIDYDHGFHASSTLVFTVDDLDAKIDELKAKDVVFVHASPNQNKWGRYAAFKDPSGIVHELMELYIPTKAEN